MPAEVTETGATTEGGGPRGPSSQGHNLSPAPPLARSGPPPQYDTGIDTGSTSGPTRQLFDTQGVFDISSNGNGLLGDSDFGICIEFGDT